MDPNLDVDLYVETTVPILTKIWLGEEAIAKARKTDQFIMAGDTELVGTFEEWIGTSNFGMIESNVA